MKKIVMGAAALLCAASMFAVDFAATVKMEGDIAGGAVSDGTDTTYIWKLNSKDQKDADALKLSVSGDNAGASFQFWYKYTGGSEASATTTVTTQLTDKDGKSLAKKADDGSTSITSTATTSITKNSMIQARSTSIWVKPVDWLKITLGDVSCGTYCEKLHWWKAAAGNDYASAKSWDHGYSSFASVEGAGIAAELTPVDGLTVVAGIAAGCDTNFLSFVEGSSTVAVGAYGLSAVYNLSSVAEIPLSIGVSWRDEGTDKVKILAVGFDYGNAFADGFYGMLNARMFFSNKVGGNYLTANNAFKMTGIAFDNFFRFKAGAMTIDLRAPFVLRGLAGSFADGSAINAANDPSYMYLSAKFSYALDGLTIYVGAGSDYDESLKGWVFNSTFGDNFYLTIHPGVTFNVGACAFDIGARFDIQDGAKHPFKWAIPFSATVGF